jgi:hypothetical protein
MAQPSASDVGPVAALLGLVDSTVVAVVVAISAVAGALGAAWNLFSRLKTVEQEQKRTSRLIEPLAGVADRLDGIERRLELILATLIDSSRRPKD